MKNFLIVGIFIFLSFEFQVIIAQTVERANPISFESRNVSLGVPLVDLPSFDSESMLKEDEINIANKAPIPYRFAKQFIVNYNLDNSGKWEILPDGHKLWRLTIRSQGAYSLNFVFSPFRIPEGAKVFLYNSDRTSILGALTSKNNQEFNSLATTVIPGDEITIEYFEPVNPEFKGELCITEIFHAYRNIVEWVKFKDSSFGASGSCNIDINCPEGANWQDEKKAVCRIIMGSGMCSGTILNNTAMDGKPYFLTANHCTGYTYANWVFNFRLEAATCGSTTDPYPSAGSIPSVTGCTLRATTSVLDFCLVEMTSMPDQTQHQPYWCGWNNSATPATNTVGIHHPSGDVKKICIDDDPPAIGNYGSGYDSNSHWHIAEWDGGVTEGGSSGSALFDENHHVVGDLTGGQAACGYVFNDYYARFDRSWDDYTPIAEQLKYWLDPSSSGVTTLDGFDFYNNGVNAQFSGAPTTIPVGSTVTFTDASTPTASITSWSWDFGGAGATPATQNTQGPHIVTYTNPGLYTIALTVSDGTTNDTETKTNYILVEDTVLNAEFSASITTVNVGGNVTFTDASSPSAQIISWDWNFGDPAAAPAQTANTQGPHVVTYNTIGLHTVTLTVSNGTNNNTKTETNYIEVIDPNAVNSDFHASATTIIAGTAVDFFDDSQNGPPVSWNWDFGNGLTSTIEDPIGIVYNNVGLYTVSLSVDDGNNTDTETKIDYIEVIDSSYLPVADFFSNFTTVFVGNTVDFYDLSTNSPGTWSWTFDNGTPTTSVVQNPTGIQYNTIGIYPVTLVVSNILGSDSITKTTYITVIDNTLITDTLKARFDAIGSRLIVEGSTVSFIDQSIGYPTDWEWDFGPSGVVPATSADQHPASVLYTTPGIYDVTLIISNGLTSDTLTKTDFIIVSNQPWQPPEGFCDTVTNIMQGEIPLTFYHLAGGLGYFPGHNTYVIRAYADKFVNYMFSQVTGVLIPVVKAYSASSAGKVRFTVWEVDSITGLPGNTIDYKDVLISSFTPLTYHSVMFDNPIPMTGEFFVGFQLFYETPQDTFVTYMAPDRGLTGLNTLYVKKGTWKRPSQVLTDSLNTSLAIELIGCLVAVEELGDGNKVKIYPNPTNGNVTVEFDQTINRNINMKLYDLSGRLINIYAIKSLENRYTFDLSDKQQGIYFLTINVDGYNITRRIAKINK
ncbi:MAG: PKD domain-containing protein [Bacteroidota bacterium]